MPATILDKCAIMSTRILYPEQTYNTLRNEDPVLPTDTLQRILTEIDFGMYCFCEDGKSTSHLKEALIALKQSSYKNKKNLFSLEPVQTKFGSVSFSIKNFKTPENFQIKLSLKLKGYKKYVYIRVSDDSFYELNENSSEFDTYLYNLYTNILDLENSYKQA